MSWVIANCLLSILAAGFVSYKLIWFGDMLNLAERVGMGLLGSAMMLTIAILWDVNKLGTPFDGWAASMIRVGLVVYLSGRLSRHIRHRRRNEEQNRIAEAHLAAKAMR